jgi:hypothetical protein
MQLGENVPLKQQRPPVQKKKEKKRVRDSREFG